MCTRTSTQHHSYIPTLSRHRKTTGRLDQCKRLTYIQEWRSPPSLKLQTSIPLLRIIKNPRIDRMPPSTSTSWRKPSTHKPKSGNSHWLLMWTQLAVTIDHLSKNFDKNIQTYIIIIYFSKAFDTVPNEKLLHKLENYGIRGDLLNLIKSFLCSRHMRVVVDDI